uniref:Immunoglobulin domain-containing protein n=1 Tax=Chelydra serpentina TaxID=8475 RepID=A0A8C3T300_CHESE
MQPPPPASSQMLGAQLSLYQTQRFLFVEISATAKIPCEGPTCIKKCLNDQNVSKFFASADGKYSSKANTAANRFSLIISNVQREDSGVYYCGLISFIYLQPNFGNGTRLIVTGEFPMRNFYCCLCLFQDSSPGSQHPQLQRSIRYGSLLFWKEKVKVRPSFWSSRRGARSFTANFATNVL